MTFRALVVHASNERFTNVRFTRCAECHYKDEKYTLTAQMPEPQAPPQTGTSMQPLPSHAPLANPNPYKPLGFAGASRVEKTASTSPDFILVPDRWRIGIPDDPRFKKGSKWNPYGQNVLKGDYPIIGQHTFLVLLGESDTKFNAKRLPVPSDVSSQNPDSAEFFGRGRQYSPIQNFLISAELFHGDTSFKPVDWRIQLAPAFNLNYVQTQENGIVNIDVREGNTRTDHFIALQEAFGEARLFSKDPYFDTTSVRGGIQPFLSDFRGFIFDDVNLGARLFGNFDNNRYQYNVVYFDLLEKDTNSELNTFDFRDQRVVIANIFKQDTIWKGYTSQFSYHYNQDTPGLHTGEELHFDENHFLVRPAQIGDVAPHEIKAHYFGWTGDGHIGRLNVTHAFYEVLGHDDRNPLAGKFVDINARMAALEASLDRDWMRFRASFFWSSGDKNPLDKKANGFDAILDVPEFAGGIFSFWNSQGIRLTQTGVALVNPDSLLPSLRSSKSEGQSNFVNPGLLLYNLGYDAELTQKIKAILNLNYLRFHHTEPLEALLFQPGLRKDIGWDAGGGVVYRPFLNENAIFTAGFSTLVPGDGFKDIYSSSCSGEGCGAKAKSLYSIFIRMQLTY